jgi:hypothetical protein
MQHDPKSVMARAEGFYWVKHIRADGPWQVAEYIGDDCWLATDVGGLVMESSMAAIHPIRLTPPVEAARPSATPDEPGAGQVGEVGW